LCADYWQGECPAWGTVVEGVKEVKYCKPSKLPEKHQNCRFPALIDLKITKIPFLTYACSKFWKSYTPLAAWIRVKGKIKEKNRLPLKSKQFLFISADFATIEFIVHN
jgi:hypothetical protein